MDVICHGIDLVDCERLAGMVERHGGRFLDRVFTAAEQAYCCRFQKQAERLAGRFAVKEAVMKLLGTGWQNGIAWTDIEVRNDASGRPELTLRGRVAELADEMGIEQVSISITHTKDLAIASAIALGVKR